MINEVIAPENAFDAIERNWRTALVSLAATIPDYCLQRHVLYFALLCHRDGVPVTDVVEHIIVAARDGHVCLKGVYDLYKAIA